MIFAWKTMVWGLLLVVALAGGKMAMYYHGQYLTEQERADDAELLAKQRQQIINNIQARQREVAALDAKYTKELADAKVENDALRRKLDNGGRVLVKGRCAVPATTGTPRTSGVGNDASVELSSAVGRNILDIRAGIIRDQQKLKYLQDYIRQECLP